MLNVVVQPAARTVRRRFPLESIKETALQIITRSVGESLTVKGARVMVLGQEGRRVRLGVSGPPGGVAAPLNGSARRSAPVVGLVGYAGAGKDAAAAELVKQGWRRLAFAEPLRRALLTLNPVVRLDNGSHGRLAPMVASFGWDHVKRHGDVRRLLQTLGTEVVRELISAEAWVDLLRGEIVQSDSAAPIVVTDVRFANEVAMLRGEFGARLIRVVRPGIGPVNGHVSDATEDLGVDGEVLNDGTPEQLCRRVLDCVRTFQEEDAAA